MGQVTRPKFVHTSKEEPHPKYLREKDVESCQATMMSSPLYHQDLGVQG